MRHEGIERERDRRHCGLPRCTGTDWGSAGAVSEAGVSELVSSESPLADSLIPSFTTAFPHCGLRNGDSREKAQEAQEGKPLSPALSPLRRRRGENLHCNPSESRISERILPRMDADVRGWQDAFYPCLSASICGSIFGCGWPRRAFCAFWRELSASAFP